MEALSINIGPLALPFGLLAFFGALMAGLAACKWRSRASPADAEPLYWIVILAGLAAARVVFIFQYAGEYLAAPLSMIDIRDGGFLLWPGLAVSGVTALVYAWRRPLARVTLGTSLVSGLMFWAVGFGVLHMVYGFLMWWKHERGERTPAI